MVWIHVLAALMQTYAALQPVITTAYHCSPNIRLFAIIEAVDSLPKIINHVIDGLKPYRKPNEPVCKAASKAVFAWYHRVGHACRMLNERLGATERDGERDDAQPVTQSRRASKRIVGIALNDKGEHAPKCLLLVAGCGVRPTRREVSTRREHSLRKLVIGVGRQARIPHLWTGRDWTRMECWSREWGGIARDRDGTG